MLSSLDFKRKLSLNVYLRLGCDTRAMRCAIHKTDSGDSVLLANGAEFFDWRLMDSALLRVSFDRAVPVEMYHPLRPLPSDQRFQSRDTGRRVPLPSNKGKSTERLPTNAILYRVIWQSCDVGRTVEESRGWKQNFKKLCSLPV